LQFDFYAAHNFLPLIADGPGQAGR
jgi:hypothetical protein